MTAEEIVKELIRQELEEQWLEMKSELKEARETISVDNLVNVFSKVLKGNGKYMVDFGSEDDSNNFILDLVNEFRKVLNKQDKEEQT